MSDSPILEVKHVSRSFGGIMALMGVSFQVPKGKIKALIGPNGAGKTTLFNVVSGVYSPTEGEVWFDGVRIDSQKPFQIAKLGVSRTFQTVELFKQMTALENVMLGRHLRESGGFMSCGFIPPSLRPSEKAMEKRSREILEIVGLGKFAAEKAGSLPLGNQKLLEVARALATDPKLILLDEPAAGLNDSETDTAAELVLKIKEMGITVVIVEHDIRLVMRVSDEVVVLNYGQKIADGTPEEIRNNKFVIEAYLGGDLSDASFI